MQPKINPEFLPLIEWWEKDGKQYVVGLLIAAVAIGGWYGWKHYRAVAAEDAAGAVASALTADELEDAVSRHSGSASAGVLRIRLAKSYFDAGRYEEALSAYEELAANAPDGFADIPAVGRAQCLEALSRFDEALKAFDAFAEANPASYLALTAKLGAARCVAQSGDKAKALERIAALKKDAGDDEIAKARIEAAEDAIKRFGMVAAAPAPEAKKAETKAKPEVKAESQAEPKPVVKAEPKAEAKAEKKPAAVPEKKPASAAEKKPEPKSAK